MRDPLWNVICAGCGVVGDACPCAGGYHENHAPFNSAEALNIEGKATPYQQDVNSSAYVQFIPENRKVQVERLYSRSGCPDSPAVLLGRS